MELSHEDIVTNILSKQEILHVNFVEDEYNKKMFTTPTTYDLTHFLKTAELEPSRWGSKYLFVN